MAVKSQNPFFTHLEGRKLVLHQNNLGGGELQLNQPLGQLIQPLGEAAPAAVD